MDFSGKVAIVTGGANGIGRAISLELAKNHVKVIVNYNTSSEKANSLIDEVLSFGGTCLAYQANIGIFEEAKNLVDFAVETFGKIDFVINNAGITKDNLIIRLNEEDFDQVIETNLKGTWNVSKHAAKYMIKSRTGKIVNITSVSGVTGNAGQTNYSASKAGVIGLTKSLARELAKRNITCNAIAPGFIETKMTESLSEEIVSKYIENIPLGRLGLPEDVSHLVLFLCSDEANYITGQVIHVDGGLVMN